jgi:hypothetical protein
MWSSFVKENGTTQVMYIAKLKDGPKRVKKILNDLEKVFEMVWWRGRKWNHIKKNFWSWSVFLLSKYWVTLLFEETLGVFLLFSILFLPLFLYFSFYAPSLKDLVVLMILEEKNHFFNNSFSNEMVGTG